MTIVGPSYTYYYRPCSRLILTSSPTLTTTICDPSHARARMDQEGIDSLLERYLSLIDEYTQLRERLSRCQSSVFHDIARANFSAERSMRYGRDHYDERMQALRKIEFERSTENGSITFGVVDARSPDAENTRPEDEQAENDEATDRPDVEGEPEPATATKAKEKGPVDPLRWFGLFAPMPLRSAQAQSVDAVENIIPRLVTVSHEMQNVEIEVRRARKKRTKAAEKRTKDEATPAGTTVEAS